MFVYLVVLLLWLNSTSTFQEDEIKRSINEAGQVRNLSGGKAAKGNNRTKNDVINLITIGLLGGYSVHKIKAYNDRIYLPRYRRSYWLGTRYYYMDNFYFLNTRDTCVYRMNDDESKNLEYEDGIPIKHIVFQCIRYAYYCCGLDCCEILPGTEQSETHSSANEKFLPPWHNFAVSIRQILPATDAVYRCYNLTMRYLHEQVPYCPHSVSPKLDTDGRIVHCLPDGEDSCGMNYSCHYSGHNYQCCPNLSNESLKEYITILRKPIKKSLVPRRCPVPMLSVVDSKGLPIKCNPNTANCPKKSMVCTEIYSGFACCEDRRIASVLNDGIAGAFKDTQSCPRHSFMVLNKNGLPNECGDAACAMVDRFCYKSYCCEWDPTYSRINEVQHHGTRAKIGNRKINFSDRLSKPNSLASSDQKRTRKLADGEMPMLYPIRLPISTSINKTNMISQSRSQPRNESNRSRNVINFSKLQGETTPETDSSNTATPSIENNREEYVPPQFHVLDARQVSHTHPQNEFDLTAATRKFLLDQIRHGWPYSDRYYLPNAEMVRKHLEAINDHDDNSFSFDLS